MNTEAAALEELSKSIPEMGGRRIGPYLRSMAQTCSSRGAIVELGCWLGAGTAQMAIGIKSREDGAVLPIHCYDNFHTSASSVEKAARQGVSLTEGQDTKPWVAETLAAFGDNIHLHKGMLGETTTWCGDPISLYVDDASKYSHTFHRCLRIFGPYWIPGSTTIVLMDYYLFRKQPHGTKQKRFASLRSQFDFITAHPSYFEPDAQLTDGTCAAFKYIRQLDFSTVPVPGRPKIKPALDHAKIGESKSAFRRLLSLFRQE